ncbi:cytochrome P450 3A17 [Ophiocordyceps sinensis CO18]|uniref:Cytochrome P450 3A17 n=1 Tax=Ophiocordyceps sinensis (strain Co18 / CGMCC 3.14243) TaxID=911162 RepID=T5A463_OPHSC|nr:cytochrome P450 3A17 [Ophiocordyceps sinensis CO18]
MALEVVAYGVAQAVYRVWFHPLSKFPGPLLLSLTALPAAYSNFVEGTWVRRVPKLHQKYGPAVRIGPNHVSLDGSIGWPEVFGRRPGGKAEFQKQPPIFKDDHEPLITASHQNHRRQRRQLGHAFSDAALAQQESIISKYVDMMLDRLSSRAQEGETVNIVEWLNFATFDIIGDLVFSESFSCLENNGYHPWIMSIFHGIQGFALRRFSLSYPLIGWGLDKSDGNLLSSSVARVRSSAKDKARARLGHGVGPVGGHQDIMAHMMKKTRTGGDGLSEGEALANAPTLVIAGSETTATALSGLCFYLSRNPHAYAMLANEIRTAFASEQDINLINTASLEYLQACINEILRVYPPAAETGARVSPGDMVDGKFVPAGTLLSVYQWATFQNPANFVEPESYIPERWLPATHARYEKRFEADNRAVFKPFSYGPRDCIGKNLAYSEMRLIICRLFYRFDFELAHNQDGWHEDQKVFGIWQKSPLYLKIQRRGADA